MAIETRFYHSGMGGMPSATVVALGGILAVLDLLSDGANVTTVTGVTRSGSTATYTTSVAHNFNLGDPVENTGWTQTEYNNIARVTAKTSTTYSVTVTGTPTTPGSGTSMSAKHPSAGWTKASLGTNITGYRTKVGSSNGHYLQVEDNNPYGDSNVGCRIRMAVGLTALDTGTQLAEQCRIQKANGGWVMFADHKTCYIIMNGVNVLAFGEIASYTPADQYNWFCNRGENGSTTATVFSGSGVPGRHFPAIGQESSASAAGYGAKLLRDTSQIGTDVYAAPALLMLSYPGVTTPNITGTQGIGAPSSVDGSVPCMPIPLVEFPSTWAVRGLLRGCYLPLGRMTASFTNNFLRLDDVTIGGTLRSAVLTKFAVGAAGQLVFDIGDTWG